MTILKFSIRIALVIAVCLSLGSTRLLGDEDQEASRLINDCGVNSLYLLLQLRSVQADLSELRQSLPDTKAHGLSMAEIQGTADHYGVPLQGRRIGPGDVPIDRPVIALLKRGEDQGHFVVLEPVGNLGKMVMVLDFPRPARILAYTDLMNGGDWTGLVLAPVVAWERFGRWVAPCLGLSLVILGLASPWRRRKGDAPPSVPVPGQRPGESAASTPLLEKDGQQPLLSGENTGDRLAKPRHDVVG